MGQQASNLTLPLKDLIRNVTPKIVALAGETNAVAVPVGETPKPASVGAAQSTGAGAGITARKPVGTLKQFRILCSRMAMQYDVSAFATFALICFFAGGLIGVLAGDDVQYDRFPAMLGTPSILFGLISSALSLGIFANEREPFRREMKQISIPAYFLAKQMSTMPMLTILPFCFAVTYSFAVKFDGTPAELTICLILANYYVTGTVMWLSVWISPAQVTLVSVLGPALLNAMFSGTGAATLKTMTGAQKSLTNLSMARWYSQNGNLHRISKIP